MTTAASPSGIAATAKAIDVNIASIQASISLPELLTNIQIRQCIYIVEYPDETVNFRNDG